jgi:peptidoglycan-associated lipoprotein
MMVLLTAVMVVFGCAKTPVSTLTSSPPPTGAATAPAAPPVATQSRAPEPAKEPTASTTRPAPSEFAAVPEVADIHFEFDKYSIRPEAARILDRNAQWLKSNGDRLLMIEGHCDERGTPEYNLALGDRRAKATMTYLVDHGVAASRITTISYGKERPVCTGHDEACWTKNRRAHFLVKRG